MEIFRKGIRYLSDSAYRFDVNAILGFYDDKPDAEFIAEQFFLHFGQKLNLENPVTFCEKIQWLKIHDRKPEYNLMVDKYEAKIILFLLTAFGIILTRLILPPCRINSF